MQLYAAAAAAGKQILQRVQIEYVVSQAAASTDPARSSSIN
jgi:hypothetical protein